jgi:hypothetical protein
MQRWQGAALALVLCTSCLDPLSGDEPGYSRFVMPAGSMVTSGYMDPLLTRKIDLNDGVSSPAVALKDGFAAGAAIKYWDFGAAKKVGAAYGLADCSSGFPVPLDGVPVLVDNVPGDTDYSAYRGYQWACVTAKYQAERPVISSLDAFNDAIELGLISDPTGMPATAWVNQPIVNANVGLTFPSGYVQPAKTAYYRGKSILYHDMQPQEGSFPVDPMGIKPGNVYELMKPGAMTPSRVIFSQPYKNADGSPNPKYVPSWFVVTLTLKAQQGADPMAAAAALDALIATLNNADDLVTVGMNNAVTVKNTMAIQSAMVTTTRANRPFQVNDVVAP